MAVVARRFDVFWVTLDLTVGREIQKTRPALIISPNEINGPLNTVIIAPMTTHGKAYPTRVYCEFEGKQALIVLDQIRTVDKARLVRKMGTIEAVIQGRVLSVLREMFAE
jgi:mRNA interferase MazF